MKTLYHFIFFSTLQLKSHCIENNVCKTIKDYYKLEKNPNCEYDVAADPNSDPTTIIEFYGYPVETHKVKTFDGYILTMFRIPNNGTTFNERNNGPVFLQHGVMGSAAIFLALGKNSLAFLFADAGYDVWLGNYRGTEYSEEHVNITVYDKQFWGYSFFEVALYDIPAMLGYVFQETGNGQKILYVGFSARTAASLMYTSTYPEQARKMIKLQILIGPVGHTPNIRAAVFGPYAEPLYKPLLKIVEDTKLIRFVSQAKILKSLTRYFCLKSLFHMQQCFEAINLIFAAPHHQTDPKSLPVAFNVQPAGTSFKLLTHGADIAMCYFRRYDYGSLNHKIYGSSKPPSYDLKKITVPAFVIYAVGDWVTGPKVKHQLILLVPINKLLG